MKIDNVDILKENFYKYQNYKVSSFMFDTYSAKMF